MTAGGVTGTYIYIAGQSESGVLTYSDRLSNYTMLLMLVIKPQQMNVCAELAVVATLG